MTAKKVSKYEPEPTRSVVIKLILSYNPSSSKAEIVEKLAKLHKETKVIPLETKIGKPLDLLECSNEIKERYDGHKGAMVYELTKKGKYKLDRDLMSISNAYKDYSSLDKLLEGLSKEN